VFRHPIEGVGAEHVVGFSRGDVIEIYLDYYEIRSGRVGRLPVRGAESLANRCRKART